jgi:membrane protein implicated in regulation of membrane protease activity
MHRTPARLAAWALLAGTVLGTVGYLSAFLANGNGDARFTGSSWTALYTIALFGDVLTVLGLPALLHAHAERSRTLTLIGYTGVLVPLVVLNVGEGVVEAFVKPYLATHGGLPKHDLPGLAAFEIPALLVLLLGMICLGVAVFRARVLPRWVGVAFIVAPLLGVAGIPGGAGLIPDYLLFVALFAVGVHTLQSQRLVDRSAKAIPMGATV